MREVDRRCSNDSGAARHALPGADSWRSSFSLPCFSCRLAWSKRHAVKLEQSASLFVRPCIRHDCDLHPPNAVDLVVLDLGENDLFFQPQRITAASVE